MKYLTHTLAAAGMFACFGSGVLAQETDFAKMTCSDFTAMSGEEQSAAYASIKDAHAMAKPGSSDAAASTDKSSATPAPATDATPAVPSTDKAATGTTSGAAAPADATASKDMEPNADVAALLKACEGNDDAFAMEKVE